MSKTPAKNGKTVNPADQSKKLTALNLVQLALSEMGRGSCYPYDQK